MGHLRFPRLPRTYRWQQVVELLEHKGELSAIVEASFEAVQNGLLRIPDDPGFVHVMTSILEWADALRSKDPVRALRDDGLDIPAQPSWSDLVASFNDRVDSVLSENRCRSDVAEIAQNSFVAITVKGVGTKTADLFGMESDRSVAIVQELVRGDRLRATMHEFFSAFTNRYLSYYWDRELPKHVGSSQRLASVQQHQEFKGALDKYVRETVRIADEFTPGWFGKARYERTLSPKSVSRFAHIAFKKIAGEFGRGAVDNG